MRMSARSSLACTGHPHCAPPPSFVAAPAAAPPHTYPAPTPLQLRVRSVRRAARVWPPNAWPDHQPAGWLGPGHAPGGIPRHHQGSRSSGVLAGYGSHQRVSEGHRGGMQASYGSHQRVSEGEGGHRGSMQARLWQPQAWRGGTPGARRDMRQSFMASSTKGGQPGAYNMHS